MKLKEFLVKLTISIALFGLIITNYLIYKSHTEQIIMLSEFNQNKFISSLEEIKNYNDCFPNLSVTALPLKAMKALYFLKADKAQEALNLLYPSIKDNPYIKFSEYNLGVAYNALGVKDSARKYFKESYYGIPGNLLHSSSYMKSMIEDKNEREVKKIFKKTSHIDHYINWYRYLAYESNLIHDDSIYKSENINRVDSLVKIAKENFDLKQFDQIEQVVLFGGKAVVKANEISEKAQNYFDDGKLDEAEKSYRDAIIILPNEFSNYENLSLVLIEKENFLEAIEVINDMEKKTNHKKNGKSDYLRGICYYQLGEIAEACKFFDISYNSFGNVNGGKLLKQICK